LKPQRNPEEAGGDNHHMNFLKQGVAMLSSVLRSRRAVQINIEIMRAFVKLRQLLSTHKDLAAKLEELEKKYDAQFKIVFDAIRQIVYIPEKPNREIACPSKLCFA
jgi:hypothetical protein